MSDLLPSEMMRTQPQAAAEILFTFKGARREAFIDEPDASLDAMQLQQEQARRQRAKDSPPSAGASAAAASAAAAAGVAPPPKPAPVSEGGPIDLTKVAPRTKTIPPPRNHILTKHPFKAAGPSPGPLCGFSATLVQPQPEDPACMFLLGGATETALLGDAYKLHINSQQWERIDVEAGGPGALFGHTASYIDGRIYVFGGLTYSNTFDFSPTYAASASAAVAPAPSPHARRGPGASPLHSARSAARSAEEEDDEARRRFAAKKLAERLSDLKVTKPHSGQPALAAKDGVTLSAFDFSGGSGRASASAESSPKLVDAAGSPGGGVGHEEEDADTRVETVGIAEGEAAQKGGLLWRTAALTGGGLLSVAKMPWKAAKNTTKVAAKVGKALYPTTILHKVGVIAAPPPKTKLEQYGVEHDPQEPRQMEIDGERVHVKLGPGAGGAASSGSPAAYATPKAASLLSSREGYANPNGALRQTSLGLLGSSGRQEVCSAGLYAFDPHSNRWAHEVDVRGVGPPARYMHSACAFPEKQCIYIFGGCAERGYRKSTNDLYKLDLARHTWTLVPPKGRLPCRRHGHSATNIGHGHMLVFGGANEDPDPRLGDVMDKEVCRRFNDTYIFDTATETWHAITTYGSAPFTRAFHMAALQSERYLYIFAGETSSQTSDCAILDLNQMVWSRPLFDGSFEQTMHGGVSLTHNNKILVYGGLSFVSGLSRECFLLNTVEVIGQNDTFTELQLKILVVGAAKVGKSALIRRFVEDRFTKESVSLGTTYRTVLTLISGRLVKIHIHDVPADASLAELAQVRTVTSGPAQLSSEKGAKGALLADVDGAVLAYDQSCADTLDALESWSEQIHAANSIAWRSGMRDAKVTPNWVPPEDPNDPEDIHTHKHKRSPLTSPHSQGEEEEEDGMGFGAGSSSHVRLAVAANKSDLPRAQRTVSKSDGKGLAYQLHAEFFETSARDSSNVDVLFLGMARKIVKDRLAGRNSDGGCTIC